MERLTPGPKVNTEAQGKWEKAAEGYYYFANAFMRHSNCITTKKSWIKRNCLF
jgi:hypothetical protein